MFTRSQIEDIRGKTFVAAAEFHDEIASTNDRARELAEADVRTMPMLIVANRQTAGRGRGSNRWWSSEDSITFSLLLDTTPRKSHDRPWSLVSLAVGVAICDAVKGVHPELNVRVKWPNDVYVRHRKLAGILIESPSQSSTRLIVGVGLNANNEADSAPTELVDKVTSLRDETSCRQRPDELLAGLLWAFENVLDHLHEDDEWLQRRWPELCALTGRPVTIRVGNREMSGICHGIDKRGALLLETASGMTACISGQVVNMQ